MSKHSPLPWTRGSDGLVFDAKRDLVVDTYGSSLPDEGDGNQELIVRGCNCHDKLLEACEAARTLIRASSKINFDGEVLPLLDTAIAKAKVNTPG